MMNVTRGEKIFPCVKSLTFDIYVPSFPNFNIVIFIDLYTVYINIDRDVYQRQYKSSLNVYQDSVKFNKKTISKKTATLYVPEKPKELSKYMGLYNRETGEKYELSDDGAIINEKLAKLLDAKVGDEIVMRDSENNPYKIKVDHITAVSYTHLCNYRIILLFLYI